MIDILLLTDTDESADLVLPSLGLLRPTIRVAAAASSSGHGLTHARIVLVDGRHDLLCARTVCQGLRAEAPDHIVLAVVNETGTAAISGNWQLDDVLITTATPAEVEMRLRLAQARLSSDHCLGEAPAIEHGAIRIEPTTRRVTVGGEEIGLTYLEFQLLAFLAQHPGRVFHRSELLERLWGQDYEGGPRTVDVHVRRLRIALGERDANRIGTIRRVGYAFVPDTAGTGSTAPSRPPAAARGAAKPGSRLPGSTSRRPRQSDEHKMPALASTG